MQRPRGYAPTVIEPVYTAEVTSTGGRTDGRARSTDGNLDVKVAIPGSGGDGTNPEELFAAGYAACFGSAVFLTARRMRLDPGDVAVRARVHLGKAGDGGFGLAAELDVTIPGADQATADEIVRRAHDVCPYSRATRGNIEVELTARGGRAQAA